MKNRQWKILTAVLAVWMVTAACLISLGVPTPTPTPAAMPSPTPLPPPTATVPPTRTAAPPAQGGGPKTVTGKVTYTNTFFTSGVAEPEVILEDQGGFITRNRKFIIPIQSQVIGQITSDFFKSPFTYTLSLPAEPNGTLHDVDHDNVPDAGVMVFAVAYWTNTWGDPYLERRDQGGGGWSTAYASTRISVDRDSYLEVTGGKYLVYAPDDHEKFPSGFGPDKKLFTDDDPLMALPAGWSVIDMDQTPFGVDRSEKPVIDLIEPKSAALDDFSKLSYTDAFDKMLDKFTRQYAFTDFKKIDWAAKGKQFRPLFEKAQADKDKHAYALALRDFLWSIPDTHVGFDRSLLSRDFAVETAGGLGLAIRETDDGKTIASFILAGGPAEKAGIKWGAEIISVDDKPIGDVVSATVPWSSPFSNATTKRLQQLRYALRYNLSKGTVKVAFKNPGLGQQTATLAVVGERDSFNASSFYTNQAATALPVEFKVLPSGFGYIKINSFLDNDVLSIQVWERAIHYFNENKIPGVILDMRTNNGGSGWLASQMAAYFFDKEIVVGNVARYNPGSGEFYMDPGDQSSMIPPEKELQYSGPVALMVGPGCISACEFFSYDMTINGRAVIVGQYPSEGAGGSVEDFLMPEAVQVQLTIGRQVDAQGKIHLEGKGVVPTVKVPVSADTLQKQANGEDVVLAAAEKALKTNPPPGAGLTPKGSPRFASSNETGTALNAGTPFLEDKAREKYDSGDFAKPGTLAYTVPLSASTSLIWAYPWCAKDKATLDSNFKNIKVKFTLNGVDVTDQMSVLEASSAGQPCRVVLTVLSDWPAGEHHLTTSATIASKINDGSADFPAGEYRLEYGVYVKP